jgi:tetratricopeptide (TPR) repeat protein
MAHRIFRLSISPEDVPEVRRVFDFDGRSSLADLHREVRASYGLNAGNPLYAFFMSGRFWDAKSAYLDPRADGERADKALLFRLGLTPNKTFAYLLDFGAEQHFVVTVREVRDSAQPLTAPQLVEAVGEPQFAVTAESEQPEPPELTELVPLAEAFLDADDDLDEFEAQLSAARIAAEPWEDDDQVAEPHDTAALLDLSAAVPRLRAAAAAAESLVQALQGSLPRFLQLDEWLLERSLGTRLLDLPSSLALAGEFELALALTRALEFVDRELMQGDQAIILARAGRRAEALALVDKNLSQAQDAALVELKAGDTHRALGDLAAAEAYYRRSLELAQSPAARYDARLRLVTCLVHTGRDAEAQQQLRQAQQAVGNPGATASVAGAGRNDPCPCGSGKKYKKCHGQN